MNLVKKKKYSHFTRNSDTKRSLNGNTSHLPLIVREELSIRLDPIKRLIMSRPSTYMIITSNLFDLIRGRRWFCLVLWHVNHYRLFNTKSFLYTNIIYIYIFWFALVLWHIKQLYCYLRSITKTIQVRRTSHAEHSWRSRKWCTPVDPFTWTSKGRTTSSNLHTVALCRYGM